MKLLKNLEILMVIVLSFTLLTVGCSNPASTSSDEPLAKSEAAVVTPEAKVEPLKVALILNGPISDMGYNAGGYNGLKSAKEKYGDKLEISYQENVKTSDIEDVARNYCENGYGLVIGHGFQTQDAIFKISKDYPDIYFSISSGREFLAPNVAAVATGSKQQGFLMGAVAGLLTKTNVVGGMGGQEMPPTKDCLAGYEAGVKYANPNAKAIIAMTGSNDDVAKAKETAFAMISEDADIIMCNADQSGLGSIEACTEKGILAIGSNMDQNELAPDTIITSGVKSIDASIVFIVDKVINSEFEPTKYVLGVKEGCVYLAPWHSFEGTIPQDVKDKLAKITQDLADGNIDMGI